MSASPPDMQRSSRRERIWNAISTLLCRPTRPSSPAQDTSELVPEPESRPYATSESTPPTGSVEGHLVAASSTQERPGEGSAAQSLSSPDPLEGITTSGQEGTTTSLPPAPIPSTHTHEGPIAVVPVSNSSTHQPCSTTAPAHDTSAGDDVELQIQSSCPLDASPNGTHNHSFDNMSVHPANSPSAAPSVLPSAALDAEDLDSPLSIAESESSSTNEETQGKQLYLTNVVVRRNVVPDENTVPLHLTALCTPGVGGSQEGKSIPLYESSLQSWTLNECIALALEACAMFFVVKDKEGHVVGSVYLTQKDLQMGGDNSRPFVTHDSQLCLSMSWEIAHDVALSPGGDLLQASDPAIQNRVPEGSIEQEEDNSVIGTSEDYHDEGVRLGKCFIDTGCLDDINGSIFALQRAVEIAQVKGHVELPTMLSNLGNSFHSRFEHTGNMSDATAAIVTQQAAVQLTPEGHVDLPSRLNLLGVSSASRFEHTGDIADLTEAIAAQQAAVRLTPKGHVDLPSWHDDLGASFASRFEHTGSISDLTEAIAAQQAAVRLTPEGHADMPSWLNNLGVSFQSRFEHTGDMSDITEAIAAQQAAVQLTPEGHENMPSWLTNLGTSFLCRSEHTGDMSDIKAAIAAQQAAVRLTPEGHAGLPSMLNNLGSSFLYLFLHTGDISDISAAIAAQQTAVQLSPEGHAGLPSKLTNLGTSFNTRFQRTRDMSDITEAIAAQQAAVRLTPKGHPDLPFRLNNLGVSLESRFEHTRDISDITESLDAKQAAVRLTPEGHVDLPSRLSNLGNSFQSRFEHSGDISDVAEAIAAHQAAIRLTPEGHADMPSRLNNLGVSFESRFDHTGNITDLTEAIAAQQAAVQLTPKGHANLQSRVSNLGKSFLTRFEHANSINDMHSSLKYLRAATEDSAGAPTARLQSALSWAHLINHYSPESLDVLVPFGTAVHLLTLVAGLERTLQGRYSQLRDVSVIVLGAAATAFRLKQHDKAVEWLEQGRCLVWGQLNGLRTSMDDLQQKDSQLAQRMTHVAEQLELAGSTRAVILPSMEMSEKISLEEAARSHSTLAREWEELLSAARHLPGFEFFLLPTPCCTILKGLPDSGHIIIVNTHQDRCDALALSHGSDRPLHIPLPDFSLEKAKQYQCTLKDVLHSKGIQMRELTQGWSDQSAVDDAAVSEVLQSLWHEVAKPIVNMLGYPRYDPSSDLVQPRIWWCPTGVMSFLPIHAAGIYDGTNSECVMDYVVSSYTPTVKAITDRIKSSCPIDVTVSGLFLTSQPKAPGAAEISGTTSEVDEVHLKAMDKCVRTLKCEGDDISVEDCRRYMGEYSSVHLACHASQNDLNPLQSRFLLHKGELSLLSIIQMNLKNADLAFLSACQTSSGEVKLSEEAVHLAAGMLAAGYRRVVATMWSISDAHAPRVATDFYDYLWNHRVDGAGEGFDGALSAHALHHAVQQLRRRLGNSERDLLTWIPYVHFGY